MFFLTRSKDLSRRTRSVRTREEFLEEFSSLVRWVPTRTQMGERNVPSAKECSFHSGHPSKPKPPIPPRDLGIMGPPDTKTGPPLGAHPILGCHPSSPKIPYTGMCLNAPPRSPTPAGIFSITVESFSLSTRSTRVKVHVGAVALQSEGVVRVAKCGPSSGLCSHLGVGVVPCPCQS